MREILRYIIVYINNLNKPVLATCTLFTGLMIFLNFFYGIDGYITSQDSVLTSFYYRYLIFLIAFALPYIFYYLLEGKNYFQSNLLSFLIIIAPAIFSLKIAMNTDLNLSMDPDWNYYLNLVLSWPARLVFTCTLLFVIWKIFFSTDSFFGFTTTNFTWKPYLLMLLVMAPLIALASTQPDFLETYPKLQHVRTALAEVNNKWFFQLVHELSYGSDFVTVELFFRGFLILAFIKVAGKDAILPMACFYCTIHFGKPLGECISSYFGGLLLGIIVFNTRSIFGGLIVHLGIAWLMELGGYIGNTIK